MKKKGTRNYLWKPPDTGFNKDFKKVIMNMLTEFSKAIKEAKEGMMTMFHQIKHINKVLEISFKINRNSAGKKYNN